jgi:major membrane immunogen (membrane-anchored lipoprotein)
MNFINLGKIAGAIALTVGLAGCMDVTMDVAVQNETNGKLTTTMVMGADFYAMAKSGMAQGGEGANPDDGFCKEAGDVLTENADGSATCTSIKEGTFAELTANEDGTQAKDEARFEVVSPGVVKVTFPTKDMSGELQSEEQDEQTKAMMVALFEGHNVTLRVSGNEILDTNMTKSADGKSAEVVIPFLDLINGTTTVPAELYATVKTN